MGGLLLDVEGTTTPLSFVYDVLFPYARKNLVSYFEAHRDAPELQSLRDEYESDRAQGKNVGSWEPASYCTWLMDTDRKSTPLKSIQGKIWESGYRLGELKGEVFPDVPGCMKRWHEDGQDIRIFSSGSILAQKLLFAHTQAGDLTPYLKGHFDTHTGPKSSPASYSRIALEMQLRPQEIMFVSDVTAELDAAVAAGMRVTLCSRPGNRQQPAHSYPVITGLDQLRL